MTNEQRWEYRTTWLARKIDPEIGVGQEVDDLMSKWAAAGWELVSANAVPYSLVSGGGVGLIEIQSVAVVRYTMFWRRPVSAS
jgi:hypothetical protein